MKEIKRCPWAYGSSPLYVPYHDTEWGVPAYDDRLQFEFLTLESAQAGLSWSTVLNKREGYRRAFKGFDPVKVAKFTPEKIESLLKDPAIIRNRLKVKAAVSNARRFLEVQKEFGTFSKYIWGFVGGKQINNRWSGLSQLPASSKESDALSSDLRARGFKFVGTTIIYAHMQAIGLVNDHLITCFRHKACAHAAKKNWLSARPGRARK
ncbi:MAG: DNA-3-methyladenine glycosylase I [Elusimicrobia bacterium CG_4_10_14_0_2_um_filter_56_8]|nr:MAG: DNA-3-methyladenine glycosylase [Elusimicrobia bacterium CG1_02_56_21]PJA16571.1 MAG: DNA-3-methyladenine glycosylase I [Elusimicrobia bacterium CG_4_10_14_0_2_um_filter_56_8]